MIVYNVDKKREGLSMKKFISGLIAGIIIASSIAVMAATGIKEAYFNNAIKLIVDGREIKTEIVTVTPEGQINGKNYVSARDLAEALGAKVEWDGAKKEIQITTGQSIVYTVTRVIDGDTFEIENGQKVRMIGIDTPESVHPDKEKNTEFGEMASAYTKQFLEGKKVRLEKDVSETDKYGRLLRYVYLEDGTFVNELLVKEGYAKVSTYPPDVKYADVFVEAERYARENNKGLWAYEETSTASEQEAVVEYQYVGSKKSNKYHLPTCRYAKDIVAENVITFKDKVDAVSKGYEPCGVCKP